MPPEGKNDWGDSDDIILERVDFGGANIGFMYLTLNGPGGLNQDAPKKKKFSNANFSKKKFYNPNFFSIHQF